MMSAALASAMAVPMASRLSGTSGLVIASTGRPTSIAASIMPLLAGICAGEGRGAPGCTSSSPVLRIATRTFSRTARSPWPAIAARAISRASITVPASASTAPAVKSLPALRMWEPRPAGPSPVSVRVSLSRAQSSCTSTVSAPSGTIAPVDMRAASPGDTEPANGRPAALSPITCHGPRMSAQRMA